MVIPRLEAKMIVVAFKAKLSQQLMANYILDSQNQGEPRCSENNGDVVRQILR
jgi:hypothetical protein